MDPKRINISFENAEKLKKLLNRATTLTKELQETLQQIQNFEPEINVDKINANMEEQG